MSIQSQRGLKILNLLCMVLLLCSSPVGAQAVDQEQTGDTECVNGLWAPDSAQSFQPTQDNMIGAGFYCAPGIGIAETITVELWSALPTAGGTLLASGQSAGGPGQWVDVSWNRIAVIPNATYYLVVYGTIGSLCLAGERFSLYTRGLCFAGPGFPELPLYDYAFHTFYDEEPMLTVSPPVAGGYMQVSISQLEAASDCVLVLSSVGAGPTMTAFGVLDVSRPFRVSPRFSESGGAFSWTSSIPAGAVGHTLFLQAIEFEVGGGTQRSNALAVLVV